jgi:hypothetical protein
LHRLHVGMHPIDVTLGGRGSNRSGPRFKIVEGTGSRRVSSQKTLNRVVASPESGEIR